MTATTGTPEHLLHHEFDVEPFTDWELAAIRQYEEGGDLKVGDLNVLESCLAVACTLAERTEAETTDGGGFTAEETRDYDRAHILACFGWLSDWYEALDSLKSGLRNGGEGPAHSRAAYRYLQNECKRWYRKLHEVRREACRWAFGTAGPQPEVDSSFLTFFDIPGIQLDGTIAAESQ